MAKINIDARISISTEKSTIELTECSFPTDHTRVFENEAQNMLVIYGTKSKEITAYVDGAKVENIDKFIDGED